MDKKAQVPDCGQGFIGDIIDGLIGFFQAIFEGIFGKLCGSCNIFGAASSIPILNVKLPIGPLGVLGVIGGAAVTSTMNFALSPLIFALV